MIERLLKYYEKLHSEKQSLQLNLSHEKIMNWNLWIYHQDSDTVIFHEDSSSLNLLSAKAYVALEAWASEFSELEDIEINL